MNNQQKTSENDSGILTNAPVCADVPTTNLDAARKFYEDILGLQPEIEDARRGVYYRAGNGTLLNLYERPQIVVSENTAATFLVENIEELMADLRKQKVIFEEYDAADLKTENGIYKDDTGFKVCWFKDPDGNLLSLEQLPKQPA